MIPYRTLPQLYSSYVHLSSRHLQCSVDLLSKPWQRDQKAKPKSQRSELDWKRYAKYQHLQVHRVRRGLSRRDVIHTMDSFYDHRSFRRRNRNLNSPSLSESRVRVRFSVLLGGVEDLFRTAHSG